MKRQQTNIEDYTKYVVPSENGDVFVDTEIFKHRKTLGNKIWDLLTLFSGEGNKKNIADFEFVPSDNYLARQEFNAVRNRLYKAVAKRDGEFCQKCGTTEDLTLDHIEALSRGGSNDVSNLRILCRSHNSQKGAK